LIDLLKRKKKSIIHIATNGSYRNAEWWTTLCEKLGPKDSVTFGVDGTPDNFTKYRKNADWVSIKIGMSIVSNTDIKSIWQYIPFNYNIKDIDHARNLSEKIGIKYFELLPSDRFDKHTNYLLPDPEFIGSRKPSQDQFKQGNSINVAPKCRAGKMHYISAEGYYSPCCFLNNYRFYHKTVFGKEKSLFDIRNTTLSEILTKPKTVEFYNSIDTPEVPGVCQFNCPAT